MSDTTQEVGVRLLGQPPKESLIRATPPGRVELRAAGDGGMPTMTGHFAVFNEWTEISSMFEGNFMERIAPRAFAKTFREQTPKVLFQHGQDPQVGDKPLGAVVDLREDATGASYEVQLLDTAYNRDLLPGLEAGLYGASFRFRVMREEINDEPVPSASNPRGLPERTIKEAQVMEFGPVTFPAYASATAGVRSMTDEFVVARMASDPERLEALLRALPAPQLRNAELLSAAEAVQTDDEIVPAETVEDEAAEPITDSADLDGVEGADEVTAPPDDRAGQFDHPIRMGRRAPDPLYTGQKETPTWQL
jgi:HK97 family phage prohead protease